MTTEEAYRKEARIMLSKINKARELFCNHMPSIGYVGEQILRQSLKRILPKEYDICQGFVQSRDSQLSSQCDIIVYRKGIGVIRYSFKDLKVIDYSSVIAIIEVKSSVNKKKFFNTLDAFNELGKFGVRHCVLFVYNKLTKKSINSWFLKYRFPKANNCEWAVLDTELYDWPDKEWLPNSILSLASCKYYRLGHIQNEYNDWVGYAAYKIIDKDNKEVSCLQEFFATIKDLLAGTLELVQDNYSIKDGFPLFRL